jgi:hypothetical protein
VFNPQSPAGAHLAAIKQLPNQTSVLFIGNDHKLNVQWVVGVGTWQGPVALSPQPTGASHRDRIDTPPLSETCWLGRVTRIVVRWNALECARVGHTSGHNQISPCSTERRATHFAVPGQSQTRLQPNVASANRARWCEMMREAHRCQPHQEDIAWNESPGGEQPYPERRPERDDRNHDRHK